MYPPPLQNARYQRSSFRQMTTRHENPQPRKQHYRTARTQCPPLSGSLLSEPNPATKQAKPKIRYIKGNPREQIRLESVLFQALPFHIHTSIANLQQFSICYAFLPNKGSTFIKHVTATVARQHTMTIQKKPVYPSHS